MQTSMLRDRIVCSINNVARQEKLLSESDFTLDKTVKWALAKEQFD